MKIAIDAREINYSGISRVVSNVVDSLLNSNRFNSYVLIIKKENEKFFKKYENKALITEFNAKTFSVEDFLSMNGFLEKRNIDLVILPNSLSSCFIRVPTIRFIHDVHPLLFPDLAYQEIDMELIYGKGILDNIKYFVDICHNDQETNFLFSNLYYKKIKEFSKKNILIEAEYLLKGLQIANAKRVITDSETSKKEIISVYPFAANKISVIYCFILEKFQAQSLKPLDFMNKPYVLNVSQLLPKKNHYRMINAFQVANKKLKNKYHFYIVGNGKSTYSRKLIEIVNKNYKNDNVHILNDIDDKILKRIYSNAELFLFPSLHEGFGIPPLEAMSFKVPVITSNLSALPEIYSNAAYLVNPFDINEISNAIIKIIKNNKLRNELIKNGKKKITLFNQQNFIKKLLQEINAIRCP